MSSAARMTLPIAISLLSACSHAEPTSCYARPADFMKAEDWWKGLPPGVGRYPRNVITVHRSGTVSWNEADLTAMHGWAPTLEMYLELVPQLEPPPLTFLEWESGAPCDSIERVRALMRKHLTCDGSRKCLQGRPN